MAKMLLLRSSDGKVVVAPAWDKRPSATPLETGVPSVALERMVQFWTKHALAKSTGESRESLAAEDGLTAEEDGLTAEAAAAVRLFRLNGILHGGRPRAAKPSESDVAVPATTASAHWPSKTRSSVGSAQAAQCLPSTAAAAEPVKKKVTAATTEQLHGPSKPAAASSLRARRGLPELSCKCPQQNPLVAAPRKKQPAKIPLDSNTPVLVC